MKRKRLTSLDILKAVACFLVVCIHAPFPDTWGRYWQALSRIAVPLFFFISGYFYKKESFWRRFLRLLALYLSSNLLYFLWRGREDLLTYAKTTLNKEALRSFLLFNESPFVGHLWFLGALLYATVITYLFDLFGKKSFLYALIAPLLLIDLAFGKYSLLLFHRTFDYHLVRNAYCVGVPNFALGLLLRENYRPGRKGERKLLFCLGILFFSLGTCLEKYLLMKAELSPPREQYISTTFLALCVFLLCLECKTRKENPLSYFGKRYSGAMYVIHMLVMDCVVLFVKTHDLKPLYLLIRPLAIFILSIPVAILMTEILALPGRGIRILKGEKKDT